ncbi:MAG: rRNA maturation RNase YbeY [Clostridia bacterium]|nr:rRNA maturation RNase YbeY [Clostridia bacterium]
MKKKTLTVFCEKEKYLDLKKLSEAVYNALGQEDNLSAELEFVSEEEIADLNKRLRKVDGVTDVLSFPSLEGIRGRVIYRKDFPFDVEDKAVFIGSVAVCVKRAEQQAEEYGHSLEREFTYLVCHGLLHLFGYDHMTDDDKREMRALEEKIMTEIDVLRE